MKNENTKIIIQKLNIKAGTIKIKKQLTHTKINNCVFDGILKHNHIIPAWHQNVRFAEVDKECIRISGDPEISICVHVC